MYITYPQIDQLSRTLQNIWLSCISWKKQRYSSEVSTNNGVGSGLGLIEPVFLVFFMNLVDALSKFVGFSALLLVWHCHFVEGECSVFSLTPV